MSLIDLPTLDEIKYAALLLEKNGISSPLIKSNDENLFLKLDCQLPGGSYKIRGVEFFADQHKGGHETIQILSAGNLALAAALRFQKDHIHCEAIVPEGISHIKRFGLEKLGASIQEKPFDDIWKMVHDTTLLQAKYFLHPFNKYLLAGYASIILELVKSNFTQGILMVPYGLGGLALALAHAIQLLNVDIKLVVCEIKGAAPFSRAHAAGQPMHGEKLKSFIEAMGTPCVIADVFLFLNDRIASIVEVTEEEVRQEIYTAYHKYHLRIEGAAGASLAAAKKIKSPDRMVSLLTGANISEEVFEKIIQ